MARNEATGDQPKRKRAPQKPRPLFVLYRGSGDIEVLKATRDAAEALETMDNAEGVRYVKVEQPGRKTAEAAE